MSTQQASKQACDVFVSIPFTIDDGVKVDGAVYPHTAPAVKKAYLDAVLAEMQGFAEEASELSVHSVTFGTGSLSTIPADELHRVLQGATRILALPREVLVFATFDPGLVSIGHVNELKAFGRPRMDLRYFTSDVREGEALGRPASETEMQKTDLVLEHAGLSDLGMQIVVGLRGQSESTLLRTLRTANRSTVSRFHLVPLPPGSPLAAEADDAVRLYACARTWLCEHGFAQRTALQFARVGSENPLWENRYTSPASSADHEVLSFGPATFSCSGGLLWENEADINVYIERCDDPQAITAQVAALDDRARALRAEFDALYRCASVPYDATRHHELVNDGLMTWDDNAVRLSNLGCLRFQEAFAHLAALR